MIPPHAWSTARPFPAALTIPRTVIVVLLISAALPVRLFQLNATGFSEDEINKLNAVRGYRAGDFAANAEHPMLMKLAIWGAMSATEAWNDRLSTESPKRIPQETALRLPNAIAGAATAGIIFLLGEALFNTPVGIWASVLWTLDVNAAAINRIGKEDTFLLLFLLLGAWLYERGRRFHAASGASFGLMLASKYMPHYFGLHALFAYVADPKRSVRAPARGWSFFVVMAAVFAAANAALFLPATWRYLLAYVDGSAVQHTGYVFAGRLYVNGMGTSPWGVPPWFYLTYFVTKVPLMVIAAALGGLVWSWRNPEHRGAVFIRVFLVFTLIPYSFVSGKFVRYMLPVLAVVDLLAAVGVVALLKRITAPAVAAAAVVAVLAVNVVMAAPHYALARNIIGVWAGPAGWLFPDDEFYDAGVREAVALIARTSAPNAFVCSEAPGVVAEYLVRNGRTDITACSIARDGIPMHASETWILDQDGHAYFENAPVVDAIRRRQAPVADIAVAGTSAVRVFRLTGSRS